MKFLEQMKKLMGMDTLTKEQEEALAKAFGEGDPAASAGPDGKEDGQTAAHKPEDDVDKKIQQAIDRATNKLGNDNKILRGEIDALRKERDELKRSYMSSEELQKADFEQKQIELEKRERELNEEKLRLSAIKAIKESGLDDGSELALELADLVMAPDETGISQRTQTFKTLFDQRVASEVSSRFEKSGRNMTGGTATGEGGAEKTQAEKVAEKLAARTAESNKTANEALQNYINN